MDNQSSLDGYARFDAILKEVGVEKQFRFLNWGYSSVEGEPDHSDNSKVDLSRVSPFERLVCELIGTTSLDQKRIVDAGCGRGGGIEFIMRHYNPLIVTGIDISPANIDACRKFVKDRRARFILGDACQLPCAASSIDVIVNLESSGAYPRIEEFFRSVERTLIPGGKFLYGDLWPASLVELMNESLEILGLKQDYVRNATKQVLEARQRSSSVIMKRFQEADPGFFAQFEGFFATPGTATWEAMLRGDIMYILGCWTKSDTRGELNDGAISNLRNRGKMIDQMVMT